MNALHLAACVAAAFVAGVVDAVAGGGGIITLPCIATFGLPVTFIVGSNKVVGSAGSTTATVRFLLHGKIDRHVALIGAPLAALGGMLGALALLALGRADDRVARVVLGIALFAMALYLFARPQLGARDDYAGPSPKNLAIIAAAGLGIGCYDGFFGPGTGSFLVFVMVRALGFDFVVGSGNAKLMNFASNLASLATYLWSGVVVWWIALPMAAGNAAGGWLGASLAIRRGASFVRWIFLGVAVAIAVRMLVAAFAGK